MRQEIAEKVAKLGIKFSTEVNVILAQTAKEITDILMEEEEFKEYNRKDVEDLAYAITRQQLKAFLINLDSEKK